MNKIDSDINLINSSGIFDLEFYKKQTGQNFENLTEAVHHFLTSGPNYKKPHKWFCPDFYLHKNEDVKKHGMNPLIHYLKYGYLEHRSPHKNFDINYICSFLSMNISDMGEPIKFYEKLQNPFFPNDNVELIKKSKIFDLDYYSKQVNYSFKDECSAIEHFLMEEDLKHKPNFWFDPSFYIFRHKDINFKLINPFIHYLKYGYEELRSPHLFFDSHYVHTQVKGKSKKEQILQYKKSLANKLIHPTPMFKLSKSKINPDRDLYREFLEGKKVNVNFPQDLKKLKDNFNKCRKRVSSTSPKKNIIIVSHDASRTGAPLIILNICKSLALSHGYELTIILGNGGELEEEFRQYGSIINLEELSAKNRWDWKHEELQLLLYDLISENFLYAICNSAESFKIIQTLASLNIPVYSLIHEFSECYDNSIFQMIHAYSNIVIYPSKIVQESAEKALGYAPEKRTIVPQGLFNPNFPVGDKEQDRLEVCRELGLDSDCKIVLGSGYVDFRKGCDLFLQTAILFLKKNPDEKCIFIWLGDLNPEFINNSYTFWLLHDLEKSGYSDKIKFIGSRKSVDKYFNAADIFLMVSRLDPFPCVVLEAMAAALPVILFEGATGSVDAINDKNGILVPYLDIDRIVKELVKLFRNSHERIRIGNNALKTVSSQYKFKNYVNTLLKVIEAEKHKC